MLTMENSLNINMENTLNINMEILKPIILLCVVMQMRAMSVTMVIPLRYFSSLYSFPDYSPLLVY